MTIYVSHGNKGYQKELHAVPLELEYMQMESPRTSQRRIDILKRVDQEAMQPTTAEDRVPTAATRLKEMTVGSGIDM